MLYLYPGLPKLDTAKCPDLAIFCQFFFECVHINKHITIKINKIAITEKDHQISGSFILIGNNISVYH